MRTRRVCTKQADLSCLSLLVILELMAPAITREAESRETEHRDCKNVHLCTVQYYICSRTVCTAPYNLRGCTRYNSERSKGSC